MAEKSIELDSVEIAAAIFGNCDRNIRLLEKEFSVTAVCRGTMLRLSGEETNVAAAVRAVEGILLLIENHTPLEDQTVRYCLSLAHDGKEQRVRELTEDFVTVTVKGRPNPPQDIGPEGISECYPQERGDLWRGSRRYRQDLSRRGRGRGGLPRQDGQPHHPDPPGRRGGRAAGLSARRFAK